MLMQLMGSVNRGSSIITPVPVGTIKTDTFAGNLSAYTVTNGSGNIAINAGKLRLTAGAGDHTSFMQYSEAASPHRLTMLENWTMSATFIAPTITASTYGFGLGVRSTNAATQLDTYVRLSCDTGSPLGSFYFYTSQNHGAPNQDVQNSFTIVGGTTYIFEVTRNKNLFTATLKTSGGVVLITTTKTYNITTQNGVWSHNVGRFCLWNFGGTIDITNLTITSGSNRYTSFVGVGDSNMHGLYATTNANRYVEQSATAKTYTFEVLGGIDQGVADCLSYLDQIVYLGSKKVYLNCVSNSIANGISAVTYKADYVSLVNGIKSGIPGVTIIHGIPVARGQAYDTIWTSYIQSTFPGEKIANLYTVTKNAGNDNVQASLNIGDNIHMNVAGNNAAAPVLTAQL